MNNRVAITLIENANPKAPLVLRGSVEDAIVKTREYGFDALEIHVVSADSFDCEKVNALCEQNGIRIASIVTGQIYVRRGLSIVDADMARRERAFKELEDYIDIAEKVNATDGIVIGWVRDRRPENDDGTYDETLAQGLKRIGLYAQDKGQKILLEVINRYETNVFNTAEETLGYIDRFSLPNTYVHMDTFHMNIEEPDMAQSIRLCGDKLGYIHFADSNRHYPGAGHTDFAPIMKALADVGYKGSLSLEYIPLPDSRTAALEGIKTIRGLMK